MVRKPTYEELEQRVKDLEKEAVECKRAEEIAKGDLIELNNIINTAVDGLCVIDKDFNVVRINKTFTTLLGISEDEALKKKCYEIFPTSLCNTPSCLLIRILGGEKQIDHNIEKEDKDGIKIPGMVVAFPYRGGGEEIVGIVKVFRDLTELKKIEEKEKELATLTVVADTEKKKTQELQKANREVNKLLKAVETAKEAINIASPDAIIIYTNNAMDELFGYDKGELIGKHESILNADSTSEDTVKDILYALKKKGSWEGEINNKRKDGSEFISYATVSTLKDEDGKIMNIISTQHDITSRKQTEEALRESEKRYRTLFEGSKDAIFINTREGNFLEFNQSFLDLFAYTREEMLKLNAVKLYSDPNKRVKVQQEKGQNGFVKNYGSSPI